MSARMNASAHVNPWQCPFKVRMYTENQLTREISHTMPLETIA